jgi:hypothetical protein
MPNLAAFVHQTSVVIPANAGIQLLTAPSERTDDVAEQPDQDKEADPGQTEHHRAAALFWVGMNRQIVMVYDSHGHAPVMSLL